MKWKLLILATFFLWNPIPCSSQENQQATAGSWPAWRGPMNNGHAAESAQPPTQWSESQNVKWKVELPGLGNSTPCVWGNSVILTWTQPTGRKIKVTQLDNPKRVPDEFHELIVAAYDLESGKELWRTKVNEAVPNETGHSTGSYASASAITDGQRVYAFFGSLGLYAVDMQGNQLWEQKMPRMVTAAGFGEGASPALKDNILVIPWDEERQSFVAGIDAGTGKELWKTDRATGSTWTTPLIVDDGNRSVVVCSATKTTRGYDLRSGQEVWSCDGMSSNPTSSPVADGDVVFVGNSFRGSVVQAIRFAGASGDLTETSNLLWTYRKSASYVPTPVVADGKLYFLKSSKGILNCLDAKTGEEVFSAKRIGLINIHASPLLAAGRLYISSREGDTVVLDLAKQCANLATNHLDDVFDASPVAIGKKLILRGRKNPYCLE